MRSAGIRCEVFPEEIFSRPIVIFSLEVGAIGSQGGKYLEMKIHECSSDLNSIFIPAVWSLWKQKKSIVWKNIVTDFSPIIFDKRFLKKIHRTNRDRHDQGFFDDFWLETYGNLGLNVGQINFTGVFQGIEWRHFVENSLKKSSQHQKHKDNYLRG